VQTGTDACSSRRENASIGEGGMSFVPSVMTWKPTVHDKKRCREFDEQSYTVLIVFLFVFFFFLSKCLLNIVAGVTGYEL